MKLKLFTKTTSRLWICLEAIPNEIVICGNLCLVWIYHSHKNRSHALPTTISPPDEHQRQRQEIIINFHANESNKQRKKQDINVSWSWDSIHQSLIMKIYSRIESYKNQIYIKQLTTLNKILIAIELNRMDKWNEIKQHNTAMRQLHYFLCIDIVWFATSVRSIDSLTNYLENYLQNRNSLTNYLSWTS